MDEDTGWFADYRGMVYGGDGDLVCKCYDNMGLGVTADERASRIANHAADLVTARQHVEALVGNAWVGLAVREGGAALCHYCGVVANVVPPARVAEFPHAADCPVAAARRWLDEGAE